MTYDTAQPRRISMPGRLKGGLAILCFQVLANGFVGYLLIDAVSGRRGARIANGGLITFMGYLSLAIALILLACVLMSGTRQSWIRPTVLGIETIGVIGGVINLFSGQVTAFIGIALAISVMTLFSRDDVREWFSE